MNVGRELNRPFSLGRRPSLDGVRAVSMLGIMMVHLHMPFAKGAGFCVDIFFVLSGFLITALLLEEWDGTGTIRLKQFYMRRVLRLLPALFLIIAAWCVFTAIVEPPKVANDTYKFSLAVICYVANWAKAFQIVDCSPLSHMWTLSVEEQFYIFWPLILIGLLKLKLRRSWILAGVVIGVAAITVNRAWLWEGPQSWVRVYNGLDTRADSLLIGGVISLGASIGLLPKAGRLLSLAAIGAMGALVAESVFFDPKVHSTFFMRDGGMLLSELCIAVGLIYVLRCPPRFLECKPMVWIGQASYGLYLWHLPIFYVLPPLLAVPATFAVAACSYYFIETPFLRLKNRFRPKSVPHTELKPIESNADMMQKNAI